MKLTLKQWRRVKDLTQESISQKLGVHINTYQKWEKNPERVKVVNAQHISKVLDVSLDEIDFSAGGTQ